MQMSVIRFSEVGKSGSSASPFRWISQRFRSAARNWFPVVLGCLRIFSITALGTLLLTPTLYGQVNSSNGQELRQREIARRVAVTIVLVDSLPVANARAVIVRRLNVRPHDVIVLQSSSATGGELAGAIADLLAIREKLGDTAAVDGVFRVSSLGGPTAWEKTEQRTLDAIVARLRVASPQPIDGFGVVPAAEVYLAGREMRQNRFRLRKGGS
jgi:hypothetical protein